VTAPASITIGGPLSRACATCGAAVGAWCTAGRKRARAFHAARREGAPAEQQATAGDLVLVNTNGTGIGRGAHRHVLALLVGVAGEHARVRLWQVPRARFARARLMPPAAMVQLADEHDDRHGPARAYLEQLAPVRGRVFDTTAHGRIRVVDAEAASIRWAVLSSEERGMTSRDEWRRATLAGDVRPAEREPGEEHVRRVPSAHEARKVEAVAPVVPAPAPARNEQLGRGGSWSNEGTRAPTTTGAPKGW